MKSILTLPPAMEPVSLAEAKAHLRLSDDAEDALILKLIRAARHHVEALTGLQLIEQGWSHFIDRWPAGPAVVLPSAPLKSIDEVRIYGEDDEASLLDPAHYYADTKGRPARLVLRRDRVWPPPGRRANGIEIRVTAGHGPSPDDVPERLKTAIMRLVASWFEHRGDDDEARRSPLDLAPLIRPFRELRL